MIGGEVQQRKNEWPVDAAKVSFRLDRMPTTATTCLNRSDIGLD